MLAAILSANFYVFYRTAQLLPQMPAIKIILGIFAVLAVGSLFTGILAGDKLPMSLATFVYKLGTSWIFIMLYMLMIFLVLDIGRLVRLVPMDFFRPDWIKFGVIAGITCIIMVCGYINYTNKARTEINITTKKQLEQPVKIVAISDLHMGYGIGRNEVRKWVELINNEKPDIVIIAGDAIDNSLRPLIENNMADVLQGIKARWGVFASPGNHEYISGIDESVEFLRSAGITVLKDSVAMPDSILYIAGRDDLTNSRRKSLEALLENTDRDKPIIVADHQPHHLEEAENNGIDLQFSGHTHRGQIWPISWITDRIFEDSYGLIHKGKTAVYVSSGIGIWGGKFRIGTKSEYVVINLIPEAIN